MRFKQKQPVVQTAINNALSGGGGGGGGTTDYTELENKPQINSVTLSGNKTTSDLGIDEVPAVTSEDNGKILKATYSEGTGTYAWESAGGFTQVQANWNETDDTDPSYIQNKPTIPAAQVQSDWSQSDNTAVDYIKNKPSIPAAQVNSDWTANSGVAQILNKPDLTDMATKTWVGNQGYLTDADEVPDVGSTDNGKVLTATYSGGAGSYAWATPASGLQIETDGTNYWITVNSIRLYFASSAPTGTIPDGSLGIGW